MLIPYDKFEEQYLEGMRKLAEAHAKACNAISDKPERLAYPDDLFNGAAMMETAETIAGFAKNLAEYNEERPGHFCEGKLKNEVTARLLSYCVDSRVGQGDRMIAKRIHNLALAVSDNYTHCNPATTAIKLVRNKVEAEEREAENKKYWWAIKKASCDMWRTNYGGAVKYTRKPLYAAIWEWDNVPPLHLNETRHKMWEIGK